MSKRISISESYLASIIDEVLYENRKVIKVPGSQQNSAPMAPDMGNMMPLSPMAGPEDNGMNMPPMEGQDGGNDIGEGTPPMGGKDSEGGVDTNFDAGVEADEDSDPKKYIQQLTGKLSQSLNSYNNDNGGDSDLSKYVANMILAAACKNIEENDKKDLIEKIKSANGENNDFNRDGGDEGEEPEMPEDEMDVEQEIPMNESTFEKILSEMFNDAIADEKNERPVENGNKKQEVPNAWKNNLKK